MPGLSRQPPLAPESFRAEVMRIAGEARASGPVAAAVSGGPDSLALLWLAWQAFGSALCVLTVDHGLRPGSAAEAEGVRAHAAALGLEAAVLTLAEAPRGNSVQNWARKARYAAMAGWCRAHHVPLLMTAHQADDQAETLLMRLARGSGPAGLGGIWPARSLGGGVLLVRPLLGVRRQELAAIVAAAGWRPVEDPANRDPRFDRTRMRTLLAREPLLDPLRLGRAAAALRESEAALQWAAARAWEGRVRRTGDALCLEVEGLPAELCRRLLARALEEMGAVPRGGAVARLVDRLAAGGAGTLGGIAASATAEGWLLRPAPPRRSSAPG